MGEDKSKSVGENTADVKTEIRADGGKRIRTEFQIANHQHRRRNARTNVEWNSLELVNRREP